MPEDNNTSSQDSAIATAEPMARGSRPEADEEIIKFDTPGSKLNVGLVFLVICAVVAIAGTVFFFLLRRDVDTKVMDSKNRLSELDAQLSSSDLATVDKEANEFKASVNMLQSAAAKRYELSQFLPAFYKKINKNVIVSSASIDNQGKVSIDATTSSYKAAGEQALTLKEWMSGGQNVFTKVDIVTISEKVDGAQVSVPFTLSAVLNKSATLTEAAAQ